MRNPKQKYLKILASLMLLCLLLTLFFPWKAMLEGKLAGMLEAKGLHDVHLSISAIGWNNLALENVTIGRQEPLTLKKLNLGYSLGELWRGNLERLDISGLAIAMRKQNGIWNISGFDTAASGGNPAPIPATADGIAAIPLGEVRLGESALHVEAPGWQADIPFSLQWRKSPVPGLAVEMPSLSFKAADIEMKTGAIKAQTAFDAQTRQWKGGWTAGNILINGLPAPMPVLAGAGPITVRAEGISLKGRFAGADKNYGAEFALDYDLSNPQRSKLMLLSAAMPWNGGIIATQNVSVSFKDKTSLSFTLSLRQVELGALLGPLTGNRATATGAVSGTLPVTINPDGSISLAQGSLKNDQPGQIAIAPDAIPGDNQQIDLVRRILKDFHYSALSIETGSDAGRKLSALLTVEGNNPAVYEGKPVKLKVHLTGDVLDFVRQNMLRFNNPEQLIRQGK